MNGFMEWMGFRNIKTWKPYKHTINTKQHKETKSKHAIET
jgi:hypothetical protein